jgi:small nuclear ribonucleoprotein D3
LLLEKSGSQSARGIALLRTCLELAE